MALTNDQLQKVNEQLKFTYDWACNLLTSKGFNLGLMAQDIAKRCQETVTDKQTGQTKPGNPFNTAFRGASLKGIVQKDYYQKDPQNPNAQGKLQRGCTISVPLSVPTKDGTGTWDCRELRVYLDLSDENTAINAASIIFDSTIAAAIRKNVISNPTWKDNMAILYGPNRRPFSAFESRQQPGTIKMIGTFSADVGKGDAFKNCTFKTADGSVLNAANADERLSSKDIDGMAEVEVKLNVFMDKSTDGDGQHIKVKAKEVTLLGYRKSQAQVTSAADALAAYRTTPAAPAAPVMSAPAPVAPAPAPVAPAIQPQTFAAQAPTAPAPVSQVAQFVQPTTPAPVAPEIQNAVAPAPSEEELMTFLNEMNI